MRTLWLLPLLVAGCDLEERGPAIGTPLTSPPTGPVLVEDLIVQDAHPTTDVLLVVDPDELDETLTHTPLILDWVLGSGVDWHLGVTTTAIGGGPDEVGLVAWIDADVPNPAARLIPSSPVSGPYSAIGAVQGALDTLGSSSNAGFHRTDAALHLVVVSSSDDVAGTDAEDFTTWLQSISDGVTVSAHVPDDAVVYLDLATSLGGVVSNIDEDEVGDFLDDAGILALGAEQTFALSQSPVPGTLEVEVVAAGQSDLRFRFDESTDYTYDTVENSITFLEYVPGIEDTVVLRYEAQP